MQTTSWPSTVWGPTEPSRPTTRCPSSRPPSPREHRGVRACAGGACGRGAHACEIAAQHATHLSPYPTTHARTHATHPSPTPRTHAIHHLSLPHHPPASPPPAPPPTCRRGADGQQRQRRVHPAASQCGAVRAGPPAAPAHGQGPVPQPRPPCVVPVGHALLLPRKLAAPVRQPVQPVRVR
jgi:hypothetical protein